MRSMMCLLCLVLPAALCCAGNLRAAENRAAAVQAAEAPVVLIGIGDSLTHGTMDGTNNALNTQNAYLQKIYESLSRAVPVTFSQPLLDIDRKRIDPFRIPTNLGVDGADIFSAVGLEYYKRAGTQASRLTRRYLCDRVLPRRFSDLYDSVLYPLNLLALRPVSQIDAAAALLKRMLADDNATRAAVILWLGNNDSSNAALGYGAADPTYVPLPAELIEDDLKPALSFLLRLGIGRESLSLDPYTMEAIERTLTDEDDFAEQYEHILQRLQREIPEIDQRVRVFVCTLPYYSSVGYLFDSDDLEYYLRKVDPGYTLPVSFARVASSGATIEDYTRGDRISLITFLSMYAMLESGFSADTVNLTLERDGRQRDGLVLAEEEQAFIMERIDGFNQSITEAAQAYSSFVSLIDTGSYLNEILTGDTELRINGRSFTRKWVRGGGFTIDGVHPGYTGQALIANYILEQLNSELGIDAPLHDIADIAETDPYVDRDGDGWAAGPDHSPEGIPEVLYLFKDPDDSDPLTGPVLPDDIWKHISDTLLGQFL